MIGLVAILGLTACSEDRPAPPAALTPDAGDDGGEPDASYPDGGGPPICDPARTFGAPTKIGAPTADLEQFVAISGDERTMAWVTPIDDQTANVFYADRASASAEFGPPQSLAPATDYFALDSVALSADGLRIVVVRADRHGFGVAVRASRDEAFGEPAPAEYSNLNPYQREAEPRDSFVGDPVLSADDLAFVYSEYGLDIVDTVRISVRQFPEDAWSSTEALLAPELVTEGDLRRRPSGISNDLRTLFFWDEIAGSEWAAWRPSALEPFDQFSDLGAFKGALPNARCRRLYFSFEDDRATADASPD